VSDKRAQCDNEVEKDCYKLQMNGNYGKMLQNQLEQSTIELFTDPAAWQRAIWRRNFKDADIICTDEARGEFLAWCKARKKKAMELNTLRFQGLVVLEWSKMKMLELHYNVMKKHLGEAAQLLFTDTDSFIYKVDLTPEVVRKLDLEGPTSAVTAYNILHAINVKAPEFDLSKCDDKDLGRKCPNKGRIGFAKLEIGYEKGVWQSLVGFLGAQAKMYALMIKQVCEDRVTADMDELVKMKAKGLPSRMLEKNFGWEDYENAIFKGVTRNMDYRMMRSRRHVVEHLQTSKIGVTNNNDKVFTLGPHQHRCLGHFRNYLPASVEEDDGEQWQTA